jgi:hypothetical protein
MDLGFINPLPRYYFLTLNGGSLESSSQKQGILFSPLFGTVADRHGLLEGF